jgi:alanyl-tRNA synthetase
MAVKELKRKDPTPAERASEIFRDLVETSDAVFKSYTVDDEMITEVKSAHETAQEDIVDLVEELMDQIKEKDERITELEEQNEELECTETIRTVDQILYSTDNLMDASVMEALAEAYETLSPQQIIENLKVPRKEDCFIKDLL